MKRQYLMILPLFALVACSSTVKVQVPPRMMMDRSETVGVLTFTSQGADEDDQDVTSRFMQAIHEEQPGVAFVDLGDQEEVLAEIGETRLSGTAVQEIGRKFAVDKILTGDLGLKESQPKVDVDLDRGLNLNSLKAQIRLDGTLDAKLHDTNRGAIIWTGSSSRWIELASLDGSVQGDGSVSLPDRERQYGLLIHDMVREASRDFRSRWERQPKQ
ncbi:MAG: hypothetical protein ABFS42_04890 [Candidatus Krumholzibacteriota bacterium]